MSNVVYITGGKVDLESDIKPDPDYWSCNCAEDYIHSKRVGYCLFCETAKDDQPDARAYEIIDEIRSEILDFLDFALNVFQVLFPLHLVFQISL